MLTPVSKSSAAMRGGAQRHLVEAGAQPIKAAIDDRSLCAWQVAHGAVIALRPRDSFGDSPTGRAAAIGGVVYISALAVDDGIDQRVGVAGRWIGSWHDSFLSVYRVP